MATPMPPVMQGGTGYSTNSQDIIEGLLSNPAQQDSTRYNANAFNPMYMVTANSTSPTGYSKFMKPVNADGSPYNPVVNQFPEKYSNIEPLPDGVAATRPNDPNATTVLLNGGTRTFDPYNGIQVDQSGRIVNAVQLGLGSDYQGSPQDVMNYLADRERQRAIASQQQFNEVNSRLVPAIDDRGGPTQPVAPSYPATMPQPMPVAPEPRLNFGYANLPQIPELNNVVMPAMPRDMMFNQQSMGNIQQPMRSAIPPLMPNITPNLPAQITPMAMQNQAPMENLQPTSSRFDQAILQKLISSVPVRRRKKK